MGRHSYRYDRSYALFSCDGRSLLTANCSSDSWGIEVSALPGRERVNSLKIPPEAQPPVIRLTDDNARVVVAGTSLRVFDLQSGERLCQRALGFDARWGCALSRDGRRVLYAEWAAPDSQLRLLEIEPGGAGIRLAATIGSYKAPYDSFSISPDGRYAMAGASRMSLWDLDTGTVVKRFEDVQFQSYATRISSDNRLAIALGTVGGNSTRAGFVTYDLAVVRPRGFRALLRQGPATEPATLIGTALSWDAHVVGFLPGSHVVLTALPDSSSDGHGWDLFLWDLDANEMSHVTHLENGWAAADISPDARSVLLIGEGTVEFLPLAELRR